MRFYGGARDKTSRLGLADLFLELQEILLGAEVLLLEQKQANGAAAVRETIDQRFHAGQDWVASKAGGIDWIKRMRYNQTFLARIGVEIQVSARSDLVVRDVVHLRNSIQSGAIDVGVIVVPDDRMQKFLPDRTPSFSDAIRYLEREFPEAQNYPIAVLAVEHDGPASTALAKKPRTKPQA